MQEGISPNLALRMDRYTKQLLLLFGLQKHVDTLVRMGMTCLNLSEKMYGLSFATSVSLLYRALYLCGLYVFGAKIV